MKKSDKKKQETPRAVYLLGAACAVALIVLVVVAIAPWQKQAGDFTPPPFEENAVAGTPTVDESLGWSELAVREGYNIKLCGVLQADQDGMLPVWLYSDAGNTVWVKLRILDAEGNRIGEERTAEAGGISGEGAAGGRG